MSPVAQTLPPPLIPSTLDGVFKSEKTNSAIMGSVEKLWVFELTDKNQGPSRSEWAVLDCLQSPVQGLFQKIFLRGV